MPSFQDSAVIFFLALLLFGPKKLPELARYVGKLMNEFRRASNEFRFQMEEEFRQAEQVEQQKKIAAIEAAAPAAPLNIPEPEHPHLDPVLAPEASEPTDGPAPESQASEYVPSAPDRSYPPAQESSPQPTPIASSGDLHMMPPESGLPVARSASSNPQPEPAPTSQELSVSALFDSIPHAPKPATTVEPEPETTTHA